MDRYSIAVTGASGLVGSHLVTHLAQQGHRVLAIARNPESLKPFQETWCHNGVRQVVADVLSLEQMEDALKAVDIVVHAAAVVDPYGSRETIFATNVKGTENVFLAAEKGEAKQFILVSSLSVITGRGDQYNLNEAAPYQASGEAYADSKVEAERLVMARSGQSRTAVTAIRPGFIYGPRERAWMPRVIDSIATGKAMLIDGGLKETNVVFVGNLNRAIEAALLNERALGQIYNLTDRECVTKKRLFDTISDGLHLPRVQKSMPGPIAFVACEIVSSIAPLLPVEQQRKLARYSRAAFRLAGLNQGFSIIKAERELNYEQCISFEEGMLETLAYFGKMQNMIQKNYAMVQ